MLHSILCWLEGVGLVTLIAVSYLGIIAVGLAVVMALGAGISAGVQQFPSSRQLVKPAKFVGKTLLVALLFAGITAAVFASKNEVCRNGFWKSYVGAFFKDDALRVKK